MGGLTRSRTLYSIVLLGLVALSLHPVDEVEEHLERAFVPARLLGALVAPLGWVRARQVRASERTLAEGARAEREACRALLVDEQASARPTSPELARGRSLVAVRFVERVAQDKDSIVVRCAPGALVQPGWPVVCGDVYVGRVRATERDPLAGTHRLGRDEAQVDLVTGRSFRVGARIVPDGTAPERSAELAAGLVPEVVIGGLVAGPPEDWHGLYLAAHVPSDRSVVSGRVRVFESGEPGATPEAALADGFLLGELASYEVGALSVLGVRAALDYASGLHQMFVLAPPGVEGSELSLAEDPFEPSAWLDAELVPGGQPSFWRAGRKLRAGLQDGVVPGAAVAAGARWIGRVLHAGPLSAEVGFAGDPGLVIHALARIEGDPRPVVLGALIGLGRDGEGAALLRWEALVPLSATRAGELPARLYTSSESRTVPPGLSIGTTLLPRGRGAFVLRVDTGAEAALVRHVRVWKSSLDARARRQP